MKKKLKQWIQRQNQNGRLQTLSTIVYYLVNLVRFHPFQRFANQFSYKFRTLLKVNQPLDLDNRIPNAVFYLCLECSKSGQTLLKIPRLDNIHSYSLWRKVHNAHNYADYSRTISSLCNSPLFGKHFPRVTSVRTDGGYSSAYIEGYNLLVVRDMLLNHTQLPSELHCDHLVKSIDDLLAFLTDLSTQGGRLRGDWAPHNLVYSPSSNVIVNVDLEGFYMYSHNEVTTQLPYIKAELLSLRTIAEARANGTPRDIALLKVVSTIASLTESDLPYNGRDYFSGYHSLTLDDKYFRGQRDCALRLSTVPYDFTNKVVLDLGCNCGGMLHCIAKTILAGIGVDRDRKAINAANLIKEVNHSPNLNFFTFDLEKERLDFINNFVIAEHVDICLILSLGMWLSNLQEVLLFASRTADALLFETNGNDSEQNEQRELLFRSFKTVSLISDRSPDDLGQTKRALYLCGSVG